MVKIWDNYNGYDHVKMVIVCIGLIICSILEFIHCRVCILLGRIYICGTLTLPDYKWGIELKWDQAFKSVDHMLANIDFTHYIMYRQWEMKAAILENDNKNIPPVIASIIAEYVWIPPPTIDYC